MQVFDYYDIPGAAAGAAGSATPEERELRRVRNMIKVAESTNYDGDPDYYGQIKALALQAGIPIKKFKSNPYRVAKAGLLSLADTALLGLIPNSMYTPQTEAEEMAVAAGTVGGLLLPWGAGGALARGAMGGLKAMPRWARGMAQRGMGQSNYRRAAQAYTGPFGFFGGRGGSRFMKGGGGRTTAPAPSGPTPINDPTRLLPEARPLQITAGSRAGRPAGTRKPVKMKNPKRNQTGSPGGRPAGTPKQPQKPKGSEAIKKQANRKYQNKAATAERKVKKADVRKEAKNINIKMTRSGKLKTTERTKLAALMKGKAYKRYQKLKGKAKADYLMNWLNQKGIKYTVG